jgi:hypothetical protein
LSSALDDSLVLTDAGGSARTGKSGRSIVNKNVALARVPTPRALVGFDRFFNRKAAVKLLLSSSVS